MRRIKNALARLFSMSFKRLTLCVRQVHKETGKASLLIFLDMAFCYLRYGTGYLDYLTFGFAYQDAKGRGTFMTMSRNLALVRKLNDPERREVFDDKCRFNRLFADCLGRGFLDLERAGTAEFAEFMKNKKYVFAKPAGQFGGKGIERIVTAGADVPRLYERLRADSMYDVEEEIEQHRCMNRLSGSSVNSVRVTTVEKDGEIHVLYALVRMSDGVNFVDNISSGGMYCPLNEEGEITAGAFCDGTGEYYEKHPRTGTEFAGFKVPYFREIIELVKRAARREPGIRYVGWDAAVTKDGPVLIEGNTIPGYDMCQNYRHTGKGKDGILPKLREILKDEV